MQVRGHGSAPGVPHGFTSHRGFLMVQLSTVGVFPHRGRLLHFPSGESSPTGGGHCTAHLMSPSPPEEIILFSTGWVFPHRGRSSHSPHGESPPLGGDRCTPHWGSRQVLKGCQALTGCVIRNPQPSAQSYEGSWSSSTEQQK